MFSFAPIAKTRTLVFGFGPAAAAVAASASASSALSQSVELRRKREVVLGDSALGVSRERHADLVPRDRQVGVVVHLLRDRREPIHEVDGADEVRELEFAYERVPLALPAAQLRQLLLNLVVT